MWPSVSEPTSPKRSASSVAPMPNESSTIINARFIVSPYLARCKKAIRSVYPNSSCNGKLAGRLFRNSAIHHRGLRRCAVIDTDGGFHRAGRFLPAVFIFGMNDRQRALTVHAVAQTGHIGKA